MNNAIATEDQERFEFEALEVLADPRMQAVIAERRAYWLERENPRPQMREAFERYFTEVVFGAIIWSLNTDPERPAVITISRIAHTLRGRDIPGSRWGIDNPDSIYRVIPISGAERYLIRGRVAQPRLTENYFTLWNAGRGTVDVLDGKSLRLDDDGRFEISVDGDEKGQRTNHVRSTPEAVEFYIRDVIGDWARERPNELSIERLGAPQRKPPRDFAEKVARACAMLAANIDDTMRWNAQATGRAVNNFDFTIDRDSDGALRNQIYMLGRFDLGEDQALVIDVGLGGAEYFLAPITNYWGTSNDIVHRTSCRNLSQAERNADGSLTLVVALHDPGAANWLDPCDIPEGILTLRWAEFAGGRPDASLGVGSRVVAHADLRRELRPETRWLTPAERRAEQQSRARSYLWRIEEQTPCAPG